MQQNGINSIILNDVFGDELFNLPNLEYLNHIQFTFNSLFTNDYLNSNFIFYPSSSNSISINDSVYQFPTDELINLAFTNFGFSSISNFKNKTKNYGLKILQTDSTINLLDYINSDYLILNINSSQIDKIYDELFKSFSDETLNTQIEYKIKEIISFLIDYQPKENKNIKQLSHSSLKSLILETTENLSCLQKNEEAFYPIKDLKTEFFIFSDLNLNYFHSFMKEQYYDYNFKSYNPNNLAIKSLKNDLFNNIHLNKIIITDKEAFKILKTDLESIISDKSKIGLVIFNSSHIIDSKKYKAILHLEGNNKYNQQTAHNVIWSGIELNGFYWDNNNHKGQESLKTKQIRLKLSYPEEVNINTDYLNQKIDSIIFDAISRGVFPGCQIFAAKSGKIIFHKSYGFHTYDNRILVQKTDLYDVASISKIAATTLAAMKMSENGKINLENGIEKYFINTKINYSKIIADTINKIDTINFKNIDNKKLKVLIENSKDTINLNDSLIVIFTEIISKTTPSLNIFKVPLKYILMHSSGINPSLPILPFIQYRKYFETEFTNNEEFANEFSSVNRLIIEQIWSVFYNPKHTDSSKRQIAEGMFLRNKWADSLWERTKELPVSQTKYNQYTDVNMILVQLAIDSLNKSNLDKYMQAEFYEKLGLKNIMFVPLTHKVEKQRIVPTSFDLYWRRQLIHGHVHDPSAAMLGGIAGNAGLFSTAYDLGVLFQMILQNGEYGGQKFISEQTIKKFTEEQELTYRGLGFDRWSPKNIIAESASKNTFGHTGFTGCCLWVDPENELVFVFLSNRIHPNSNNQLINNLKIRQKVHQVFYDAQIKTMKKN